MASIASIAAPLSLEPHPPLVIQISVTKDSLLYDLIDDGDITQAQSETAASFMHGLMSQFIADPEFDDFKVNYLSHAMQLGERLLLCSDGLNEVLNDTQIAKLLVSQGEDDLLNTSNAARRAGGTTDFSVIVFEVKR